MAGSLELIDPDGVILGLEELPENEILILVQREVAGNVRKFYQLPADVFDPTVTRHSSKHEPANPNSNPNTGYALLE